MSADSYLKQLHAMKEQLPADDILGIILAELLLIAGNKRTFFKLNPGSANTITLYKNDAPWGAFINFKAGNLASFVHELTHASCGDAFQADLVNYKPKKRNGVARVYTANALPNTPADTRACTNEIERRKGWYDDDAEKFLTLNLNNLKAWSDVTEFSAAIPWLDSLKTKQMNALNTLINSGSGTIEDMNKHQLMQIENEAYGVLIAPTKDKHKRAALKSEANRKRAFIEERISYGRVGMGGSGDCHNEYDTVINQMLCQMYMWGFRPQKTPTPSFATLSAQIRSKTVPASFFYTRLEMLAQDAYDRRNAAKQIQAGTAPAITTPMVIMNPPKAA